MDTSETGDEGFYKASSCEYDAIVLDVMLPKMDGWEVLKQLRTTKTTPVLMLTARDATTDRITSPRSRSQANQAWEARSPFPSRPQEQSNLRTIRRKTDRI